ncbi:MAG: PocR ligand-binding domain-containing protein, partial [Candidatus Promineifilaceae bacterium]|nr:PocR ligand-binding domain-containing protein [Candidatus Promineifilaceae bacterium]
KQWRFPSAQIHEWVSTQMSSPLVPVTAATDQQVPRDRGQSGEIDELVSLLPLSCVQLIQDSHADLLGVMLVVTDMDGNPITEPSRPCGLFSTINKNPDALQRCISSWHDLGQGLNIEPEFHKSHLGLLCARGLIRVGTELKGMVVAGCVAPEIWPPENDELAEMAKGFGVPPTLLKARLHEVYHLNFQQKSTVLNTVQKVANIVAHIVNERLELVGRLDAIADLALAR